MLLRVHNFPESMGALMPIALSNYIPFYLVLYGFSNYFFLKSLANENLYGFISFIGTIANVFLPAGLLLNKCLNEVERDDKDTFEKSKSTFRFNYDTVNPSAGSETFARFLTSPMSMLSLSEEAAKENQQRKIEEFEEQRLRNYVKVSTMRARRHQYKRGETVRPRPKLRRQLQRKIIYQDEESKSLGDISYRGSLINKKPDNDEANKRRHSQIVRKSAQKISSNGSAVKSPSMKNSETGNKQVKISIGPLDTIAEAKGKIEMLDDVSIDQSSSSWNDPTSPCDLAKVRSAPNKKPQLSTFKPSINKESRAKIDEKSSQDTVKVKTTP